MLFHVFPSYTHQQLRDLQLSDPALSEVWEIWRSQGTVNTGENSTNPAVRSWIREYPKFIKQKGILYREVSDACSGEVRQFLVPAILRSRLLEMVHDHWGHQGVNRTFSILRTRCFWPGLFKDIKTYISNCLTCRATKSQTPQVRTCSHRLSQAGQRERWL